MAIHTTVAEAGIPPVNGSGSGRIRPLRGQVLVRLSPFEYQTRGGLHLPDIATTNERGEKQLPRKAIVVAIGPWRTTRDGRHSILPDFQVGQRVLVSEYFGTKLTRRFGDDYRLCRVDDVLAVLEETLEAPPAKA